MAINRWLVGGALLAAFALPAASAVLASNGDIIIGTNATNGDIHVNGLGTIDHGPQNGQGNIPTCVSGAAPDTCPPDAERSRGIRPLWTVDCPASSRHADHSH
jgi:hypothetical protein